LFVIVLAYFFIQYKLYFYLCLISSQLLFHCFLPYTVLSPVFLFLHYSSFPLDLACILFHCVYICIFGGEPSFFLLLFVQFLFSNFYISFLYYTICFLLGYSPNLFNLFYYLTFLSNFICCNLSFIITYRSIHFNYFTFSFR